MDYIRAFFNIDFFQIQHGYVREKLGLGTKLKVSYILMIHDSMETFENDFATDPKVEVRPSDNLQIKLSKITMNSINTQEAPCVSQSTPIRKVCKLRMAEDMFLKKYNCTLPFMDSKHIQLCPIIDQSRNETYADIAEYFEHMIDYSEDHGIECPQIPRCKRSLYKIQVRSMDKGNPSQSRVKIQLDNPYVQTIEDSIAYDLQSLIGEVGGTLGLFLGLSTYSFVEFLVLLINKMFKE